MTVAADQSTMMWPYIGAAAAWAVAFIGYQGFRDCFSWLRMRRNRPELTMSLQDPIYTEAPTQDGKIVRFYHLRVQNTGKTDAANCRARLMAVWSTSDDKNVLGAGDVPLHWAHKEPETESLVVPGGEVVELDLFTQAQATPTHLQVFGTRRTPDGLRKAYEPGEYSLKVRLTADNADPRDLRLNVAHRGSWEQPAELTHAGT